MKVLYENGSSTSDFLKLRIHRNAIYWGILPKRMLIQSFHNYNAIYWVILPKIKIAYSLQRHLLSDITKNNAH